MYLFDTIFTRREHKKYYQIENTGTNSILSKQGLVFIWFFLVAISDSFFLTSLERVLDYGFAMFEDAISHNLLLLPLPEIWIHSQLSLKRLKPIFQCAQRNPLWFTLLHHLLPVSWKTADVVVAGFLKGYLAIGPFAVLKLNRLSKTKKFIGISYCWNKREKENLKSMYVLGKCVLHVLFALASMENPNQVLNQGLALEQLKVL